MWWISKTCISLLSRSVPVSMREERMLIHGVTRLSKVFKGVEQLSRGLYGKRLWRSLVIQMSPTEPIFSFQSQCLDQYCLSFLVCVCHLHKVWWTTRSNPTSIALIGRQGTVQTSKKWHRSTPKFWLGSVDSLIRCRGYMGGVKKPFW